MREFNDLLEDLSKVFEESFTATNNSCLLMINDRFKVQIELDKDRSMVNLVAFIYELPPGRIREEILKSALQANYLDDISSDLAYIPNTSFLVAQSSVEISTSGEMVYEKIGELVERADRWISAINSGLSSPVEEKPDDNKNPSIFDINS